MSKKQQYTQPPKSENQKLIESLIDLYLSVKIRSNDEIDNYTEDMLSKERQKLRDTDAYTILDYIKTSIEILMNMKMEEYETSNGGDQSKSSKSKAKLKRPSDPQSIANNNQISDTESMRSMDEPPKDYEAMLQKYEAEVRNHIKIEQQLKLHIECVQDKLDDSEKAREKMKKEKSSQDEEITKDLQRYKELLSLREKEIESLKKEYKRVLSGNEEFKKKIDLLERENRSFVTKGAQSATHSGLVGKDMPLRSVTVIGNKTIHEKSSSQAILEELKYNQNFENHTTDQRNKQSNKAQLQQQNLSIGQVNLNQKYHNMVRSELSKMKNEAEIFDPNTQQQYQQQQQQYQGQQTIQKSPDRMINNQQIQYQTQGNNNNNSFIAKSPYISSNNKLVTQNQQTNDYNAQQQNKQRSNVIVEKQALKDSNNSTSKTGKIFQPVGLASNSSTNLGPNHKRAKSQIVNQPGLTIPGQASQQNFKNSNNPNHTVIMNAINDDHRKFMSENSIDNTHPHNQSYVHYNQNMQQFTDQQANGFTSNTMDARLNHSQISHIPTSILSGTYINSNIIVHQKHIDASARNQPKKQNVKRTSSIHEEKKMIPNESAKHIISASGGHMRTGSYDMNVAVQAMLQQNNQSFIGGQSHHSIQNPSGSLTVGTHHKKKSVGGGVSNTSNKNLLTQNYLSAGNTTHMTSFNINQNTNNSMLGSNGPIHSQHAISVLDHHSFDNGIAKQQQQRPQSQMSSYQRKLAQKNSMLAVATQKKKENALAAAATLTNYTNQKRGDTYRGSPTRFQ
eukprot:403333209